MKYIDKTIEKMKKRDKIDRLVLDAIKLYQGKQYDRLKTKLKRIEKYR